jgi:hypothetical protein
MGSFVQKVDPWADADICYYIQEYEQQNFHNGYNFYPGAECRFDIVDKSFKELIFISVSYIPDKMFGVSTKQPLSNHCIAISKAAEHVTELGCCKCSG